MTVQIPFKRNDWFFHNGPWFRPFCVEIDESKCQVIPIWEISIICEHPAFLPGYKQILRQLLVHRNLAISSDDIHDFCCSHLRSWWSWFGEYCIRSRIVFYNITSEYSSTFVLWVLCLQLSIFQMTHVHQWCKMNFCARHPCFIDHLLFTSVFCQVPRRNFSNCAHSLTTAALAAGIFDASINLWTKLWWCNELFPFPAIWSSWWFGEDPPTCSLLDSSASNRDACLVLISLDAPLPKLFFKILKGKARAINISNFWRAFLMVSLNSLSSGSTKKILQSGLPSNGIRRRRTPLSLTIATVSSWTPGDGSFFHYIVQNLEVSSSHHLITMNFYSSLLWELWCANLRHSAGLQAWVILDGATCRLREFGDVLDVLSVVGSCSCCTDCAACSGVKEGRVNLEDELLVVKSKWDNNGWDMDHTRWQYLFWRTKMTLQFWRQGRCVCVPRLWTTCAAQMCIVSGRPVYTLLRFSEIPSKKPNSQMILTTMSSSLVCQYEVGHCEVEDEDASGLPWLSVVPPTSFSIDIIV